MGFNSIDKKVFKCDLCDGDSQCVGFCEVQAIEYVDADKQALKAALNHHFKDQQKLVGFSSLGGRPDLFDFAGELKNEGAITILAGSPGRTGF